MSDKANARIKRARRKAKVDRKKARVREAIAAAAKAKS